MSQYLHITTYLSLSLVKPTLRLMFMVIFFLLLGRQRLLPLSVILFDDLGPAVSVSLVAELGPAV
jgi:hypothetical protein